jgi:GT2 family glycosyltransferase
MQFESTAGISREACLLSVSVVVYRPDPDLLNRTLETLSAALERLNMTLPSPTKAPLYLIDNGTIEDRIPASETARGGPFETVLMHGHGNVGYGRGHNLAIERTNSQYHLILNPDIELESDALDQALRFMRNEPATGLISPLIHDVAGDQQFLCRRFPTVFDLFARGFLPSRLRVPFKNRLARYEMRDVIDDKNVIWSWSGAR